MKSLKTIPVHPFKSKLNKLGVTQSLLAKNLNISQAGMGQMLNGYISMPSKIYDEISELLENLEK